MKWKFIHQALVGKELTILDKKFFLQDLCVDGKFTNGRTYDVYLYIPITYPHPYSHEYDSFIQDYFIGFLEKYFSVKDPMYVFVFIFPNYHTIKEKVSYFKI